MRTLLGGVVFVALALALAATAKPDWRSVERDGNNGWRVVRGLSASGCASGYFEDQMLATGWDQLFISTNAACDDHDAMYAAGYLEGTLTFEKITFQWANLYPASAPLPEAIVEFLTENLEWTELSVNASSSPQSYWKQVGYILDQLRGMTDGYNSMVPAAQALTLVQMSALSAQGDLEDISTVAGVRHSAAARTGSHCSGLIKVADDLSELYIGHSTWNTYINMLRMYKQYSFALNDPSTEATMISFSSYPGTLLSIDDFYANMGPKTRLVSAETTNGCMNATLLSFITPTTGVLSWVRTMVANRMASTAPGWQETFSLFCSYTYNNQFYVVDYNLFSPGQPLVPNTIWISEQYPGGIISQDVTQIVTVSSYWPSYNVPFNSYIYNLCEFPQNAVTYGPYLFSYQTCARAEIFRRNQSAIYTTAEFQNMMRYNDWEHDPFAVGNAGLQISSRFDLVNKTYPNNPTLSKGAFGAIDSKMTSAALMSGPTPVSWAQCGPTHDQQPTFAWANGWSNLQGEGQPNAYDFDWQLYNFQSAQEQVDQVFAASKRL